MSDELVKVPSVVSLANPRGRGLLEARFEVQRNPKIQETFEKYKGRPASEASHLAEELISQFSERIIGTDDELSSVCQYLADEYLQIGDSMLIIDRETGRAIMRITDDDFWEPSPVARESGNMVSPGPRLRPELQGFLIRWSFEKERETQLVRELSSRLVHVNPEEEDRRLKVVTRAGRTAMSEELRESLDRLLPDWLGGTLGSFMNRLRLVGTGDPGLKSYMGFKAYAKVIVGLQDHKARNLSFDVLASHRSVIAVQWAREIARTVANIAHEERGPQNYALSDVALGGGMWLVPPDEAIAIQSLRPGPVVVPIEGVRTTAVRGDIGDLVLGVTKMAQREVHDRWEIVATLEYGLHLDLSHIEPALLLELPLPEVRAQVVR